MRLLANDLGPAKVAFLCYPFRSREVRPFWIDSHSDQISVHIDLLPFNSVSSPVRFPCSNSKYCISDFLTERMKKNASTVRFAAGICEKVRYAVKSARSLSGFAPRVQVRKSL